jgi:uncharacterized iron-regulated membrane protein
MERDVRLYRTLWRWHFYAGLLVVPMVLVLALSGTVFLFKPQIDRWEERTFRSEAAAGAAVTPQQQVAVALAAFPGSRFHSYRLPVAGSDVTRVHLALPDGAMRDVFVSPQGALLGSFDAGTRIVEIARRIHGQLLLGRGGSLVVELAACWAIVMLLTGLYLWWPRGRGLAGVLWPRRRALLRDLHAVGGFWISAFAMVLLLTGLPWTDTWGSAFRMLRQQMGWVAGPPQWSTGAVPTADAAPHVSHDHEAMQAGDAGHAAHASLALLDQVVARVRAEQIADPAVVLAPGAMRFGVASPHWVALSDAQNRPLGITISYDADSGAEVSRQAFGEQHVIDRVIGYGLAWHEGALFGVVNQVIGVITAATLAMMSVTGFMMWRRRRPAGVIGAPPGAGTGARPRAITLTLFALALVLPLLAASLVALWLLDRLLPRVSPAAAKWLGMAKPAG